MESGRGRSWQGWGGERQGEELARLGLHIFSPESESLGSSCVAMVGSAGGSKTGPTVEGEASPSEQAVGSSKARHMLGVDRSDHASHLSPSGWSKASAWESMWTSGNSHQPRARVCPFRRQERDRWWWYKPLWPCPQTLRYVVLAPLD